MVYLKIIRIYQIDFLHYPIETYLRMSYSELGKQFIYVYIYAISTLINIGLLLHYLAVFWIWIGSDRFIGYEEGLDPWQLAN